MKFSDKLICFCFSILLTSCSSSLNDNKEIQYNIKSSENNTIENIVKIKSFDNYYITGKLNIPNSQNIDKLVIYVPGTGPHTYDMTRSLNGKKFNYYDLFSKEFNIRNIGFFRYNTRGTEISDLPPNFDKINKESYQNYLPMTSAKDIENIITFFKKQDKFKNTKIYLLGWSEGSMIAPIVAEKGNVKIDGLLLAGYVNDNMKNIIEWQHSGESPMIVFRFLFDKDLDLKISRDEFKNAPQNLINEVFGKEAKFEEGDIDNDGFISKKDFEIMLAPTKKKLFESINNSDDDWIWNNYFRITSKWAKEHFKLAPNKERLLKLNLPIHIFHGKYDQNTPVEGVLDIEKKFKVANKNNLNTYIFDNHDHSLNYTLYPLKNVISNGIKKIFTVVEND